MANYAMHYFNKLTQHVIELDKVTASNVKLAYVLGNSWLKGVYVETDDRTGLAKRIEPIRIGGRLKETVPEVVLETA